MSADHWRDRIRDLGVADDLAEFNKVHRGQVLYTSSEFNRGYSLEHSKKDKAPGSQQSSRRDDVIV